MLGETEASSDDSGVCTMQTPLDPKILESQEECLKCKSLGLVYAKHGSLTYD